MFRFLSFIFIFFATFPSVQLFGQDLSFKTISTEEGLPSNEIYSLLTDHKGYIWGATDGGIFRFNGKEFKVYTINDGLPDNTILKMEEDYLGRMWLTCFNGKIAYIENEKIHQIAANQNLGKYCKNALIISICIAKNGTLWLGATNHLLKIPPKNNYKEIINVDQNKNIGFYIKEISENQFLACRKDTSVYMVKFPKDYKMFFERIGKPLLSTEIEDTELGFSSVRHRYLKDKRLIFSLTNIMYIQDTTGRIRKKKYESNINFIYEDENGLWVCTERNGVYLYENNNLNAPAKNYLKNFSVLSITSDKEKGIWFGTYGKGLLFCPSIEVLQFTQHQALGQNIIALRAYKNSFFVMNENNYVFEINQKREVTCVLTPPFSNLSEKGDLILDGHNLICFSKVCEKIDLTNHQHATLKFKNELRINATQGVLLAANKYLLLSYNTLLMVKNDFVTGNILLPARGRSMAKNKYGSVYIGTLNGIYEFKNKQFKQLIDSKKLLQIRINHILPVGDELFISTNGNGLLIYNVKSKKIIQITEKQGIPSDFCTLSMYTDREIWLGSKKGLTCIQFKKKGFEKYTIKNFDQSSGLMSREINSLLFKDNELWVGTRKGLCLIRNPYTVLNSVPPVIYLENFLVNNINRKLPENKHVYLNYQENNLLFKLSNLSYKNSSKHQFCYLLSNRDSSLKYTSYSQIEFQNLPSGDYTLKIFALNNLGIKSLKPLLINIHIASPFWFSWWFILLEIVLILFLFALVTLLITKRLKKKELLRSSIEHRILEHQLLAIRAQMNPHFIFNAINSIQNFILISDSKSAHFYLGKFSKLIRSILNNSSSEFISIEDEINIMSNYIDLEKMRLNESMDYEISYSKDVKPSMDFIPNMLLQPLIENAIIHGLAPLNGRRGKLNLHFYHEAELLCIRLEDNGIGRIQAKKNNLKKEQYHQSMGVNLVQEKINVHAILNKIDSQMVVEDLYDDQQQAAGTRVTISIRSRSKND